MSLFLFQDVVAQSALKLDNNSSILTITGTSNVHNWEMTATGIDASILVENLNGSLSNISSVDFSVPSKNIKSHNNIMDKKTWEAIKADRYKTIEFNLSDVVNFNINGTIISGNAMGLLTIAGKSNQVSVPFNGKVNGNNEMLIEGKKEIKLIEFDVEPPTAMMGTLKTGDSVNILFSLNFTPK
jgi:polyisoprenoid-binding protein YceI